MIDTRESTRIREELVSTDGRAPSPAERVLLVPAISDWVLSAYFVSVVVGLTRAPASPERNWLLTFTSAVLIAFLGWVYVYRLRFETRTGGPTYVHRLAYRLLPLCALLSVYFNLRAILPLINPALYDAQLFELDLRVFGFEPTLAIEPYLTQGIVEWFAFFYYSYFFFVASFCFVMVFTVERDRMLAHFATGMLMVVGMGHFLYTLVPGFGPYAYLAHEYAGPLPGGAFFDLVLRAVHAGGPMRDIFPSLHTALPTFLTLFAWRYHRPVAVLATFCCANIIGATIVLRWHYALDVVAGLMLAWFAYWFAPRLVETYQARRETAGLGRLRRW